MQKRQNAKSARGTKGTGRWWKKDVWPHANAREKTRRPPRAPNRAFCVRGGRYAPGARVEPRQRPGSNALLRDRGDRLGVSNDLACEVDEPTERERTCRTHLRDLAPRQGGMALMHLPGLGPKRSARHSGVD